MLICLKDKFDSFEINEHIFQTACTFETLSDDVVENNSWKTISHITLKSKHFQKILWKRYAKKFGSYANCARK